MRVMTADGTGVGDSIAAALAAADPAIAAIASITPADACSAAAKLSLRYAVQCWDVPEAGKAIFWKPGITLQGLYRTEFARRDPNATSDPRGLLRVTFLWDGQPLHVLCVQFSTAPEEIDWQLVQVARELNAARGLTLLAIEPAAVRPPSWPGFTDVWSAARFRSVAYPSTLDAAEVARAAFGVTTGVGADAAFDTAAWLRGGSVRLFCSDQFFVLRASHRPWPYAASGNGPLVAELISYGNGGSKNGAADGTNERVQPEIAERTGTQLS